LKGINRFEVDLILDVGANAGQFALQFRSLGYKGRLVSFEPLSSAHAKLEKTARRDSRWTVHPRCAIGAQNGGVEINIAGNSMFVFHTADVAACISIARLGLYRRREVPMFRLDTVAPPIWEKRINLSEN
jgi:FkbM family methyltransferase